MKVFSTFNPSSMPPELLEGTFVQRESLADRLVEIFEESALRESKHNALLVGPRGIGKSHLVSLVYHRLRSKRDLAGRLAIAYLREDEWGVSSFLDLLIRILREVSEETGLGSSGRIDSSLKLSTDQAEVKVWESLHTLLAGKTLLLIVENIDMIFEKIGEQGQRQWRALMQTYPQWAILATTPALFSAISRQVSPFYGFFEVNFLQPLSVDDAIALLKNLARWNKDEGTLAFLDTAVGRARVRAVQHLAGGNHRIFVLFYEFLVQSGSEQFMAPLLKTVDALTPYYQSQMTRLSPQQQKIVNFLCEHQSPATVTTVATHCRTTHQTAASQLKQLLGYRYVRVDRVGRESFYELTEPLLRICVEVKGHSGRPIDLLVDFIRYWFSREELERKLAGITDLEKSYFLAALKEYDLHEAHTHLTPEIASLCVALGRGKGKTDRLREQALELAELSKIAEDWSHYGRAMAWLGKGEEAIPVLEEALRRDPHDVNVLRSLAFLYTGKGAGTLGKQALDKAIELEPNRGLLHFDKAQLLLQEGLKEKALEEFEQAAHFDVTLRQEAAIERGRLFLDLDRAKEAIKEFSPLLQNGKSVPSLFVLYGVALFREDKIDEAFDYFDKATDAFPGDSLGWANKGILLSRFGRYQEALVCLDKALQLEPAAIESFSHYRCEALIGSKQFQIAVDTVRPETLSHGLFHALLDVANSHPKQGKLQEELMALKNAHSSKIWQDAFRGALTELASSFKDLEAPDDLEDLRIWNSAIQELFAEAKDFVILVKLFDVLTRVKALKDRKAILELPREQRLLLLGKSEEEEFMNLAEESGTNA